MSADKFKVKRYFSSGCFSLVFEVESTVGSDKGNHYALKLTLLEDYLSLLCASRERRILERITREKPNCPHLPTLYYSFIRSGSPFLVMSKCSELTLHDIINEAPDLTAKDIVIYTAEIMCGLEALHSMQVVHLELNEFNILVSESGHLVISDFDRSCDLSTTSIFEEMYFVVRVSHAAPEIRSKKSISTKADIWSLGITVMKMLGKIKETIPKNVTDFINKCLIFNPEDRPNVSELKEHCIFNSINWSDIALGNFEHPIPIDQSVRMPPTHENWSEISSHHKYLLEHPAIYLSDDGTRISLRSNSAKRILNKYGVNEEMIRHFFQDYQFVNPTLVDAESESVLGQSSFGILMSSAEWL